MDEEREIKQNKKIIERMAKAITNANIGQVLAELQFWNYAEKDKIIKAFNRGVWFTLYLISNNHELGFIENEGKKMGFL